MNLLTYKFFGLMPVALSLKVCSKKN